MIQHTHLSSVLNEKVEVLSLIQDETTNDLAWHPVRKCWAAVDLDLQKNIFSSIGIGARGATIAIRAEQKLSLHQAIRWRGQFLFLTSIILVPSRDKKEVKAALCTPIDCQADVDQPSPGIHFPGILTEKYVASSHEQLDPYAMVTANNVLVTPKAVKLDPGSWVQVGPDIYQVLVPHELDEWKNEYEIQRKADC